jgi:polyisoprenoid-binding protein YceI
MRTLSFISSRFRVLAVALTMLLAMGCAGGFPGMGDDKPRLPAEGAYQIDTPHTFVQFSAQHQVVGRVNGRFDRTTGTVTIDDDLENCRVDISIDARSLSTHQSARDEDLHGPDFFDSDNHPTIEYHGRGIRKSGDGYIIDGVMTIRDVKQVVPLAFEFRGTAPAQPGRPSRVAFHGTAAVQREDFKMTRELLKEIGSVSESPDVWIDIDAELLALP